MAETTVFISAGRSGQVIKLFLSLFSYTTTRLGECPIYLPFLASFATFVYFLCLIKSGAKDDSTACLLPCFKDKALCFTSEHSEFVSDASEDIRGDIFTCDVPGKRRKSVRGTAEYFNNSATRVKLALGYTCKAQMSSVNWKMTNLHASICVGNKVKPVEVKYNKSNSKRDIIAMTYLTNNLSVLGQGGGYWWACLMKTLRLLAWPFSLSNPHYPKVAPSPSGRLITTHENTQKAHFDFNLPPFSFPLSLSHILEKEIILLAELVSIAAFS